MKPLIADLEKLKNLASPLTAFFIGTGLTCCAYALMTSILSIRLAGNGVSTSHAGMILALYYVGYVFASLKSYKIINRVGHIRAFSAYISAFAALSLTHSLYYNPVFWGVLRLLEGYCIGTSTMCLESWLNTRATNKNRGVVMSLYMVTTYMGSGLAQIMLNIPDPNGVLIYIIVSMLFSISLIPISLTALPTPEITISESMPLSKLYRKTPVGVMSCLISGIFVGAFYMLGTIYTKRMGLSIHETSLFMFFGVFGGMSAQIPMGRLSDKMDRRFVILGAGAVLCLLAPVMHYTILKGEIYIAASAFIMGSCLFTIYPICVSHINDLVEDNERVQASGKLILLQGCGLIIGPVLVSYLMEHFGIISFAISFSAAAAVLAVFIAVHLFVKPKIGYVHVTPTTPIPVSTTAVFEELSTKDNFWDRKKKSMLRRLGRVKETM